MKFSSQMEAKRFPLELEQYQDAMQKLKGSDHYILVMAESALVEKDVVSVRTHPARDLLIYIAIGLALVAAAFLIAVWRA